MRLNLSLRDDLPTDPGERADIQITVDRGLLAGPGCAHHLLDDPYVAVLPAGHPLAGAGRGGAGPSWPASGGSTTTSPAAGAGATCWRPARRPGSTRRSTSRRTTIRPRSRSSAAGIGVTVLPRLARRDSCPRRGGGAGRPARPRTLDLRAGPGRGGPDAPAVRTVLRVLSRLGCAGGRSRGRCRTPEPSVIRAARIWAARHGRGLGGRGAHPAPGGDQRDVDGDRRAAGCARRAARGTSSATSPSCPTCW